MHAHQFSGHFLSECGSADCSINSGKCKIFAWTMPIRRQPWKLLTGTTRPFFLQTNS